MAAFEEVLINLEWEKVEIQMNGKYLNNLRLADDIILMSEPTDELQKMILQLHTVS